MITHKQAFLRLSLIILVYTLLGLAHSVWLPLGQAPDEIDHFRYIRFIARHGRLPLDDEERQAAGNKAYLPAAYHGLTASLIGWSNSDTSPHLKFVWESPRRDLVQALFHTRYMINTEDELTPYRGAVLMWHLGRIVSLVLGAMVIVMAFFTALAIFPKNYHLAVIAVAIIAFVPGFIFISASISYEPLVALVIGLYFWVLVRVVKGDDRLRNYIGLGLLMGLAVTVKYIAVILPVQLILVTIYLGWRNKWGKWVWLKYIAVTGVAAIVGSSWWFIFLAIYFNQIETHGVFVGLLKPIIAGGTDATQNYTAFILTGGQIGNAGQINRPPFFDWAWQMYQSFWLQDVGGYPLGGTASLFFGLIGLITLAGLVITWKRNRNSRLWIALLFSQVLFFLVFPLLRFLIQGELSHTAQGRHLLFPIATTFPLLVIYGWQPWFSLKVLYRLALIIIAGLVSLSIVQLVHVITFYPALLPIYTTPNIVNQIPQRLDLKFGNHLVLLGHKTEVIPEKGTLEIDLFWQSPSYADEDYLMEINLVQNDEVKLNWLAYPVNGRYPTRVWESNEVIIDRLEFPLFDLPVGSYQIRLKLRGYQGTVLVNGQDSVVLTEVKVPQVAPFEPDIVLPVFVDQRQVVNGIKLWHTDAYRKLNRLEYQPRMAIPFVWQGQLGPDERVNWLLVDSNGKVYPAQQSSTHFQYFMVAPDWLPGEYHLRAEIWQADTVLASQETTSLVTIFNKQPRLTHTPPMAYFLEANFADRVKLLGYDLPERFLQVEQEVPITLYWQGLRTMDQQYTFFAKLLDQHGQDWGSVNRYPKDGYKTTHWLENEVVVDQFKLLPETGIPNGVYWLNVGLYFQANQSAISLPLVESGMPTDVTSVTFGPLKIGGPPPDIVVQKISPEHSLDVVLGHKVRLHGYKLLLQEQELSLKLYWESLKPLDQDYTVFMHVKNAQGEVVAQMDRPPTGGLYPTSLWEPGEIIIDELSVPLPENIPSGQYTLVTGMYNFKSGIRLPVAGSVEDVVLLSVVEIP